jgi:hypothetical protein
MNSNSQNCESSKQKLHNCVICLNKINVIRYLTPCNHTFHKKCIIPWIKEHNSCPICRESIDKTKPIKLCQANDIDEDYQVALRLQSEFNNQSEFMSFADILDRIGFVIRFCENCNSEYCICDREFNNEN